MIKSVRNKGGEIIPFDSSKTNESKYSVEGSTAENGDEILERIAKNVRNELVKHHKLDNFSKNDIQDIVAELLHDQEKGQMDKNYIWGSDKNGANGTMNFADKSLSKGQIEEYWFKNVYRKYIREAHENNDIIIDGLDKISPSATGWTLSTIMEDIVLVYGNDSLWTIFDGLIKYFHIVSSEGGALQGISSIDSSLAPFVVKEGIDYDEIESLVRLFVHEMECVGSHDSQNLKSYKFGFDWVDQNGDESIQNAMDMVNKAFLTIFLEGTENHQCFKTITPIYPILDQNLMDHDNGALLYDLIKTFGTPFFQKGKNIFGVGEGESIIGKVAINLPKIGYLSFSEEEFFCRLENVVHIACEALNMKQEFYQQLQSQGFFPHIKNQCFVESEQKVVEVLGAEEAVYDFYGELVSYDIKSTFIEKILKCIDNKLSQFERECDSKFVLQGCYDIDLLKMITKDNCSKYPDMYCHEGTAYREGIACYDYDRGELFDSFDLENKPITKVEKGRFYYQLDSSILQEENRSEYFTYLKNINTYGCAVKKSFTICYAHGYHDGAHAVCPDCEEKAEMYGSFNGRCYQLSIPHREAHLPEFVLCETFSRLDKPQYAIK